MGRDLSAVKNENAENWNKHFHHKTSKYWKKLEALQPPAEEKTNLDFTKTAKELLHKLIESLIEFRDAPQACHDYILDKVVHELEAFFSSGNDPVVDKQQSTEKLIAQYTEEVRNKNEELTECEKRIQKLDKLLIKKKAELKANKKSGLQE
jgi:Fe-S-cluster formation regulator IscX/YfhJ